MSPMLAVSNQKAKYYLFVCNEWAEFVANWKVMWLMVYLRNQAAKGLSHLSNLP